MIKDFQSDATENRGAKIVILKNLLFCSLNESLKIKGIWYMRQLSIFYSLYLHQTWDFLTMERPICLYCGHWRCNSISWNLAWVTSVHLPVSFIILMRIENSVCICKEKNYYIRMFIWLLKLLKKIPYYFQISRPIKGIYKGGQIKIGWLWIGGSKFFPLFADIFFTPIDM